MQIQKDFKTSFCWRYYLTKDDIISGYVFLRPGLKMGVGSDIFMSEIKWGQDLENRVAHSNKNSQGYPLPPEYISSHKLPENYYSLKTPGHIFL